VRDLAILFRTIAGADERDAGARRFIVLDPFGEAYDMPRDPDEGYEHHWLHVTDDFFPARCDDAMQTAFDAMVRKVVRYEPTDEKIGRVQPITLPAGFGEVTDRHHTVMAVEAAAYHEPRFRRHPEDYPPKITALIERGLRTSAAEYARCKQAQARLTQELRTPRFRALLVPATPAAAPSAQTTGDPVFNSPWSFTGMPVVSLPFAWTPDGLPLALQLVAKQTQEDDLFQTAAWVEQVVGFARRPLPL
jgi:aspartyl-tRNA(Asn)/glutamyl-tRNA(Gln) amidotransferase subunit A